MYIFTYVLHCYSNRVTNLFLIWISNGISSLPIYLQQFVKTSQNEIVDVYSSLQLNLLYIFGIKPLMKIHYFIVILRKSSKYWTTPRWTTFALLYVINYFLFNKYSGLIICTKEVVDLVMLQIIFNFQRHSHT